MFSFLISYITELVISSSVLSFIRITTPSSKHKISLRKRQFLRRLSLTLHAISLDSLIKHKLASVRIH